MQLVSLSICVMMAFLNLYAHQKCLPSKIHILYGCIIPFQSQQTVLVTSDVERNADHILLLVIWPAQPTLAEMCQQSE